MFVFFFDKIHVLEPNESSHVQYVYPSTSLDESSIEFETETDKSIYLDKREIHLQIKFGLRKKRLFDDFIKKVAHGKADMDTHYLTHVNNILHSLFFNCEVYLNNHQVYNSNGLYGHKALISNEFDASTRNNKVFWIVMDTYLKKSSGYEKNPFIDRDKELLLKNGSTCYGKLDVDFFQFENYCFQKQNLN